MIENLVIRNFKSIENLELGCKKLNVFIGEPNSGKSNIIEALALQSQNAFSSQLLNHDLFRYKTISDLFFDFNLNKPIQILTDQAQTTLTYQIRDNNVPENEFNFNFNELVGKDNPTRISHEGKITGNGNINRTDIVLYQFKKLSSFQIGYTPHLTVPFGENLPGLLLANSEFRSWVSGFFKSKDLLLTLKPNENDITVSKFVNDEIYSYPYLSTSETLQRVVFYNLAIRSNLNKTLLFDEPESNTFPFYTKFLGEAMALDETNQFFVTTHNPYLLLNLIEKSDIDNLNVGIVQMKNHKTVVTLLDSDQIGKVLDFNSDVFFNFNQIIEE